MRFSVHPEFGFVVAHPEGAETSILADFLVSVIQGAVWNCEQLIDRIGRVQTGMVSEADFSGDVHECSIEPSGVRISRWEDGATCVVPLDAMLRHISTLRQLIDEKAKK